MVSLQMLKIYDVNDKQVEFKSCKVIRQTEYVEFLQLTIFNKKFILIRFVGIASFTIPLYEVFRAITFQIAQQPSKQLGEFMQKVYQQLADAHEETNFKNYFWGRQPSEHALKLMNQLTPVQGQSQTNKINEIIEHSPKIKQILAKKQSNKLLIQALMAKIQNNLRKFTVVARSKKIDQLNRISAKLKDSHNAKIFRNKDKTDYYFAIQGYREGRESVDRIITLQKMMNQFTKQYHNIIGIQEKTIETLSCRLLNQICKFQEKMNGYYNNEKAGSRRKRNSKENEQQINISSYINLDPYNTLLALKRKDVSYKIQENDKTTEYYKVCYTVCDIDYDLSQTLLDALGITFDSPNQKFKRGPLSIGNYLKFYSTVNTPINKFDFQPFLKKLSQDSNRLTYKQNEVKSIISWLMIGSLLYSKLLNKDRYSIFQDESITSQNLFQSILMKDNSLGNEVGSWLILYEMQAGKQLDILGFTYMEWQDCIGISQTSQQTKLKKLYERNKYDQGKLVLQAFEILYFGTKNIKYFVQKTSYFNPIKNIGRYILLYLFLKLGQITFELSILETYGFINDDLQTRQYGLKHFIDRFSNMYKKVQLKINEDYKLRTDKQIIDFIFKNKRCFSLLDEINGRKFGSYCKQDTGKISEQAAKQQKLFSIKQLTRIAFEMRAIIQQLISSNKAQVKGLTNDEMVICCKNQIEVRILLGLNLRTYSDMIGIYDAVQTLANSFPQSKDFQQVRSHFQKYQKQLGKYYESKLVFNISCENEEPKPNTQKLS